MVVTNEMIEAAALRWATMDRKRDRFLDDKAGKLGDLDGCYEGYMAEAKEILTAALAVAPGVEVKPLEWTRHGEAVGFDCRYTVYEAMDGWNCVKYPHGDSHYRLAESVTEEAAKSAAQTDYTARIMSALATTETNGHE